MLYGILQYPLDKIITSNNPTNSVNFELSKTEQANIILKVLLYSGVVIRDPSIVNIASQQVQQETQRSTL